MPSTVELAIAEAVRRREAQGEVTATWLRSKFPDCWEEALRAVELERALQEGAAEVAVLGPYRLGEMLGRGGMGSVYEAQVVVGHEDLVPGTIVAIKVLHPSLVDVPQGLTRFLRELEIGCAIRHPNVMRTLGGDVIVRDGERIPFIVMERVPGRTLRDVLEEGPLAEDACRWIVTDAARGLAALHAAGVVHRDVKPDNLFVTDDGVVKVMDLGVARIRDVDGSITRSGQFLGSAVYSPLEQILGSSVDLDGRADLYALGVTAYELATGTTPFDGCTGSELLKRKQRASPPRIRAVEPAVSSLFDDVVAKLMAADPPARYETADEVVRVLSGGDDGAPLGERSERSAAKARARHERAAERARRDAIGCPLMALVVSAPVGVAAWFIFDSYVWRGAAWAACVIFVLLVLLLVNGDGASPPTGGAGGARGRA